MKKLLPKKNVVEEERNRIIEEMKKEDPASERYKELSEALETLNSTLDVDKKGKVSGDTVATLIVQGGLMGLVYLFTRRDILPNWFGRWFPKGRV